MTPYLSGLLLAIAACLYAKIIGLDRDGAFYPTMLLVIASTYALFAAEVGGGFALFEDSLIALAFFVVASFGFKRSPWLIVAGIAAHGVLDAFHGGVVSNAGVPVWWPAFCSSFDLTAAAFMGWSLSRTAAARKPRVDPNS